jgi:hypothetical protein
VFLFRITWIEFSRNFKKKMQRPVPLVILKVVSPAPHLQIAARSISQ